MVIKSDKRNSLVILLEFLCIFVFSYFLFKDSQGPFLILSFIIIVLYIVYVICDYILISRKFTFSIDGVEISILKYKKFYKWEEIKFRKLESYNNYRLLKSNLYPVPPYKKCLKLFTKHIKNSNKRFPDSIMGLCRPLSFIYVNFLDENVEIADLKKYAPTRYVYNERDFFQKLKEWNIEIEEDL